MSSDGARALRGGGGGRDALEGKGPQRWPWRRWDRRLEEVAKAVDGGYCRLQMPLRLALGVRGTVAGRRLGALEGGGVPPPPSNASLGGGGGHRGSYQGPRSGHAPIAKVPRRHKSYNAMGPWLMNGALPSALAHGRTEPGNAPPHAHVAPWGGSHTWTRPGCPPGTWP